VAELDRSCVVVRERYRATGRTQRLVASAGGSHPFGPKLNGERPTTSNATASTATVAGEGTSRRRPCDLAAAQDSMLVVLPVLRSLGIEQQTPAALRISRQQRSVPAGADGMRSPEVLRDEQPLRPASWGDSGTQVHARPCEYGGDLVPLSVHLYRSEGTLAARPRSFPKET
jgi:hypothetical protein